MIKIRYADLPDGLHADVRTCGRRPVIYLLPGLSAAQRRDALRRLIRYLTAGARATVAGQRGRVRGGQGHREVHRVQRAGRGPVPSRGISGPGRTRRGGRRLLRPLRHRDGAVQPAPRRATRRGRRRRPRRRTPAARAGPPEAGPAPRRRPPRPPWSTAGHRRRPPPARPLGRRGPDRPAPGGRPAPRRCPPAPGRPRAGVLPSAAQPAPSSTPSPAPSPAPPASPGAPPPGDPGGLCVQAGPLGVCISG